MMIVANERILATQVMKQSVHEFENIGEYIWMREAMVHDGTREHPDDQQSGDVRRRRSTDELERRLVTPVRTLAGALLRIGIRH